MRGEKDFRKHLTGHSNEVTDMQYSNQSLSSFEILLIELNKPLFPGTDTQGLSAREKELII